MLELNKVMVIGNLTFDPEYKMTPAGRGLAKLRMAVNRRYKQNDEVVSEAMFLDVDVWGKTAEFCRDYLVKGTRVYVEGRLHEDRWEDRESGQKRSKIKVVADRVQFAESKSDGGQGGGYQSSGGGNRGGGDQSEDDLPF